MFKLKCLWLSTLILIPLKYATAWTSFENLEGGVNHVASSSWGPGRIDVFGAASDAVYHKRFANGAWSGWENLGGVTKLKPSAFSIKPNWVDVVVTGTDQMLYRKTWNGAAWTNWQKSTNGGVFISGPTITASPGDTKNLHVFGISTDNKLYHSIVDVNDNNWTLWQNLGGDLVGDPAAVSWGNDRLDVFCVAPDKQIWQKTWDNGWQDWKVLPGGKFKPGVGAATKGPGRINVFGKGLDDAIYQRTFANGKWYDIESVGGVIRSSPSAVSTGSTRVDVFAAGKSDGRVYRSYWDTSNFY